jgi:hypothetical protein
VRIDQIDAIRPACICLFRRVAKLVENGGKFDIEFSHASPGNKRTLFFSLRATENDCVFNIALHLPHVARMCFRNVNHQESNPAAVLLVKRIESGSLPPERRSGVAAEYQHHGLRLIQFGKLDSFAFVQLPQPEVRCRISDVQVAGTSVHPCGFKWEE